MPPLLTCFYLIRHGEREALQAETQAEDDAAPLTRRGRQQAQQVAICLQPLHLDAAYCSPLQRARETATLGLASQPLIAQVEPTLREWYILPLRSDPCRPQWKQRCRQSPSLKPPVGESLHDCGNRGATFLWRLTQQHTQVAIFGHQELFLATCAHLLQIPMSTIPDWGEGVIRLLSYDPARKWSLEPFVSPASPEGKNV